MLELPGQSRIPLRALDGEGGGAVRKHPLNVAASGTRIDQPIFNWIFDADLSAAPKLGKVAIGNYAASQDANLIGREQIAAVIRLGVPSEAKAPQHFPDLFTFEYCVAGDARERLRGFRGAVAEVVRCRATFSATLVQCESGRSLSAAILAGYLVSTGIAADDAVRRISERHPQVALDAGDRELLAVFSKSPGLGSATPTKLGKRGWVK